MDEVRLAEKWVAHYEAKLALLARREKASLRAVEVDQCKANLRRWQLRLDSAWKKVDA